MLTPNRCVFVQDRLYLSGMCLEYLSDFRSVGSQNVPLENWLSRPGSPSELPAHQTPAADPGPWAHFSPGSPTEHKEQPK